MKEIFDMLKLDSFYNRSEEIEIAKGKNEIPTTVKQALKQAKRVIRWKQKR
jgi:hypothetical protein